MGESLSYSQFKNFLLNFAQRVLRSKDELNRMDAACGDGDFGTTMYVAFDKVLKILGSSGGVDVGTLLLEVGQAILSSAGGTAGPIFGTLFASAGNAAKSKSELEISDLAAMFEAALRKVEARGHAHVGDKTLIDVLDPAVASLKNSTTKHTPLLLALEDATNAAETGFELTKSVVAKQGKARYLGEQTLGKPDPGAYVTMLMFDCLRNEVNRRVE
ncbi:MAG: dihydroxyacetone kinase subunit DhaL [Candidatus Bathyarchaeia archaeon]